MQPFTCVVCAVNLDTSLLTQDIAHFHLLSFSPFAVWRLRPPSFLCHAFAVRFKPALGDESDGLLEEQAAA